MDKKDLQTLAPDICPSCLPDLSGCEGTETHEKVDDTVKELSGQKNLERMDQMKRDIADINKQQADRLKEPQ